MSGFGRPPARRPAARIRRGRRCRILGATQPSEGRLFEIITPTA
jgi:hypothetical protein